MTPVLEVHNLVKDYGTFRAVDRVSFVVPKGKIIGLLGPNGAGKTTTIQMLLGITKVSSGSIKYFGHDFVTHRQACLQRINFTSSFNTLQNRITVMENLSVFAMLYGVKDHVKKVKAMMDYFGTDDVSNHKYMDLSAGQKARVNIIKSLLNDPELILMDEPTASLDPDIADKTLGLIEDLKQKRGISIVYTSHDMEEITRICDEVIFLDHGTIVAHDTPLNLTKRISDAQVRFMFDGDRAVMVKYLEDKQHTFTFHSHNNVLINVQEHLIPSLIFGISKIGIMITDIEVKKPSLEDVFLQIARSEVQK